MTADTGANNLRVIHSRWLYRCPGGREHGMTAITGIGRVDMRIALTAGRCSIVAIDAVVGKTGVVNSGRQPGAYRMTGIAFFCCTDVVSILTGRDRAVMTARASTNDFVVIHAGRCNGLPRCGSRCMAGCAIVAAIDVRRTFT